MTFYFFFCVIIYLCAMSVNCLVVLLSVFVSLSCYITCLRSGPLFRYVGDVGVCFFFLCSLNSVCFLLTLIDFQFLTLASVTTCFPSWINHQPELYLPMASLPASKCFLAHLWQWTWHKGRPPTFLSLGYCCILGFNKDHKSTGKINE